MNINWQKKRIEESRQHQEVISDLLNGHNFVLRDQKNVMLEDNKNYVEFISCSYLGLDQHPKLIDSIKNNLDNKIGLSFSASRTRLKFKQFDHFENMLNQIYQAHSVFFSSTHIAHLGFIPLLASGELPGFEIKVKPMFFLDTHVHASVQINQGLMQQFGELKKLDFSDLALLKHELETAGKLALTPILIADSVGSMGGVMPVTQLLELAEQYNGYLYLDDAHGMSVYGKNGCGYALEQLNHVFSERLIIASSLAKAFGTYGGVIVIANKDAAEFIKKYCSTYIFSGQPLHTLLMASIQSAEIHLSPELDELRNNLATNLELFDNLISKKEKILNWGTGLPIRLLMIGDEIEAINKGFLLKEKGFLATVATYPIVAKQSGVVRIAISANHTPEQIKSICFRINEIL